MTSSPSGDQPTATRVNYHIGMLLGTDDFEHEQGYHRAKLRRHNRELHGWGIARGLEVEADAGMVVVQPGFALDPNGEEIWIQSPVSLTLGCEGPSTRVLAVRYHERLTEPVAAASRTRDAGVAGYRRVEEGFAVELFESALNQIRPGSVVLAHVNVSTDGAVLVDPSVRRALRRDDETD